MAFKFGSLAQFSKGLSVDMSFSQYDKKFITL